MTSPALFSIATVCLNAEPHIAEAIESVLAQSFDDFEYLIVDGGSTDGTMDIVRTYEPRFDGRLRWISEPDRGLYDAMNKALALATGEYIEFLGADDQLEPDALGAVARALGETPRPDIVCGAALVLGPHGNWTEPPTTKVRGGLPQRAPARHQSVFIRRDAALAAGGFDTHFRIAADYELYLRLVEAGSRQVLIPETLSRFRLGGVSSTDAWATAREYRDVRVAHGAKAWVQQLAMVKSALAAEAFAVWKRATRRGTSAAAR